MVHVWPEFFNVESFDSSKRPSESSFLTQSYGQLKRKTQKGPVIVKKSTESRF